ncbi:MAG: YbaY family lipoprotein [Acidobacteriota bacterium]
MRRLLAYALPVGLTACVGTGASSPRPTPASPPEAPPATQAPAPTATPSVPIAPPPPGEPAPSPPEEEAALTGSVTYVQRVALTPEAVVQVELRDASQPEGEGPLIAKQVIRRPGQVPIAFTLEYDPSAILPGHSYVVSARIMDRGQLQFVTDIAVPVAPRGAPGSVEILVGPVR